MEGRGSAKGCTRVYAIGNGMNHHHLQRVDVVLLLHVDEFSEKGPEGALTSSASYFGKHDSWETA